MTPTDYPTRFQAQVAALGSECQHRLRSFGVLVVGAGRLGWTTLHLLAGLGCERLLCVDPQAVSVEDLGHFVHAVPDDVGTPKVAVHGRFLGRRGVEVAGVHAPIESPRADRYVAQADLVVLACNRVDARIAGEAKALAAYKPSISIGATDARRHRAGSVSVRIEPWHACAACYLTTTDRAREDDGLVLSQLALLASHAAHLTLQVATQAKLPAHNFWWIDADDHRVTPLAVQHRDDCHVCRRQNRLGQGAP